MDILIQLGRLMEAKNCKLCQVRVSVYLRYILYNIILLAAKNFIILLAKLLFASPTALQRKAAQNKPFSTTVARRGLTVFGSPEINEQNIGNFQTLILFDLMFD